MKSRFQLRASEHLDTSEGKRTFNEKHFAESAARYDFATRALSLGQDGAWKKLLIAKLPDVEKPTCLDIACGTGDVAFLLAERFPEGECIGVDLTAEMIEIARERNDFPSVRFECADMGDLPVADETVDILTGSYAIRNAPDLCVALREFRRVMKPGGTLAFLDFAKPESSLGQKLQYALLRFWGGLWGLVLHGNVEIHGYIAKSLRTFPAPSELEKIYAEEGLSLQESIPLMGGMMRLHVLRA